MYAENNNVYLCLCLLASKIISVMKNHIFLLFVAAGMHLGASAQVSRLGEGVNYNVEFSQNGASGDVAPLWLTANRHGLMSVENSAGYLRAGIDRKTETDSTHRWKFGYGLDLAMPYDHSAHFAVQQLYGEVQYRKFRISLGSKERSQIFKNDALSSGDMLTSVNARPIPQLRAELADWWDFTGRAHFMAFRGFASYGMMTDGRWQEDFVGGEASGRVFAKKVFYHTKAGFFKVGDERRFPLTGTFGLEMTAMFGGEVWNLGDRAGTGNEDFESHQKMSHGFRDFLDAFIAGGSDSNDGAFANAAGNQLGSWKFTVNWVTPTWGLHAYMDHFFEDHSQMLFQYGWRDNLFGLEAHLPKNPYVSQIVYENLNTADQSGGVYHDATDVLPIQISGRDTYYNHHVYGAYQHWGQTIGNPLIVSPAYNNPHVLFNYNNRVRANHIGLSGNPSDEISWRLLYTHHRSFGTYEVYFNDARSNFFYAEAAYSPRKLNGWHFTLGYGCNTGDLLGSSHGFQATIRKTGLVERRKK